jgi:hypothetical protein
MIELRFILFVGAILVIWATLVHATPGPAAFLAALFAVFAAFGGLRHPKRDRATRSGGRSDSAVR